MSMQGHLRTKPLKMNKKFPQSTQESNYSPHVWHWPWEPVAGEIKVEPDLGALREPVTNATMKGSLPGRQGWEQSTKNRKKKQRPQLRGEVRLSWDWGRGFVNMYLSIKEVSGKGMRRAGKMPHHLIFSIRGRVRVGIYMLNKSFQISVCDMLIKIKSSLWVLFFFFRHQR